MQKQDKPDCGPDSESSEGDRFAHLLDGLLSVPRSEIETAIAEEKAAKKIKAASRATSDRRR